MIGKYTRVWVLSAVAAGAALVLTGVPAALAQGAGEELPVIELSVSNNTVTEGDGDISVIVTATLLSDVSLSSDVVVSVATVDYTAEAGSDYRGFPISDIIVPSGNNRGSDFWDWTVIDDQDIEDTEILSIVGSAVGFSVIGTDLYILDDDIALSGSSAPFAIAGSQTNDNDFSSLDVSSFSVAGSQNDVATQPVTSPAFPTLLTSECSDGTYVTDPDNNAGLVSDCETLIAIRDHWIKNPDNADLPPNHPLRSWRGNINNWRGVEVENGRVSELRLRGRVLESGKDIGGTIPAAIGNLTNLKYLQLSYNDLTGTIPAAIGNLTNLKYLQLSYNDLTGTIPATIGNLTNLISLYLGGNSLTGSVPDEFRALSNLVILSLYHNQLSGRIPSVIESLANLEYLALYTNQFNGSIPSWLGNLTRLRYLDADSNQLTGSIPVSLGNLNNLAELHLRRNRLSGHLPPELGNLSNIKKIYLGDNKLSGSIPSEWGSLINLKTLDLNNNRLSGDIPSEFRNLTNLLGISLGGHPFDLSKRNNFTGTLDWISNSRNLIWVDLRYNNFEGNIPPSIGNFIPLNSLNLMNNNFTGSIPKEFGNLYNLEYLYLSDNSLSGDIPMELSNLVPPSGSLHYFAYCGNYFTGSLPIPLRSAVTWSTYRYTYDGSACQRSFGVNLSTRPSVVNEGDGSVSVAVTASLAGGQAASVGGRSVTVSVGDAADSATAGSDYTAVDDFTITIAEGERSGSGSFDLTVADDNVAEGSESLSVSGSSGRLAVRGASVSIADDDDAPTTVGLSVDANGDGAGAPTAVAEGSSGNEVAVTAAFPEGSAVLPSDTVISVSVSGDGGDGGAEAGDFTAVDDFDVTIPAGAAGGSGSFTLTATEDEAVEGPEAITVSGTTEAAGLAVASAEVSITDNDAGPTSVALSVDANGDRAGAPTGITEGADAAVLVTASFPEGSKTFEGDTEVTVSVGKASDGAVAGTDYAAVNDFTVTIPGGRLSGSGTFILSGTDDGMAGEAVERLTVSGAATGFKVSDAAVSITDGDTAPTGINISLSPATAEESSAGFSVGVTVSFPDGSDVMSADTAVTVSVGEGSDSVVSGTDYAAVDDFTVTIPAGRRSGTGKFVLAGTDDDLAGEGAETLTVSGTATGFTASDDSFVLTDGDGSPTAIGLSVDPARPEESSGAVKVTVTASFPDGSNAMLRDAAVSVSVGGDGDGAVSGTDYAAVDDFTVTIPAGQTSGSNTFSLAGTDDDLAGEGAETITVSGTAAGFAVSDTELSLADGDDVPTVIGLSSSPSAPTERELMRTVRITASFPDGSAVLTTEKTVTISVGKSNDSAVSGTDYTAVDDFAVTIPAGQTSGSNSFSLAGTDDDVSGEGSESITVFGTAAGFAVSDATVSLVDGDAAPTAIALGVDTEAVVEGAGARTITVTASFPEGSVPMASDATVAVSVGAGSASPADYTATPDSFNITIPAGQLRGTAAFTLTAAADSVNGESEAIAVAGTLRGYAVTGAGVGIADPLDNTVTEAGCSDGTFVIDPASNTGLAADCRALVGLRNQWGGEAGNAGLPAGHPLRTWGSGKVWSWEGVAVSGGRVTGLSLAGGGIAGRIPARLGDLTGLTVLDLSGNDLGGAIPDAAGDLTGLTRLDLSDNGLTGSIPDGLSDLTSLTDLDLSGNELSGGIPERISGLAGLTRLDLSGNDLTGSIPTRLGDLSGLRVLDLSGNDLAGLIPDRLGRLRRLTYLDLGGNSLSGSVPEALGRLADLTLLDLSDNDLSGAWPERIGGLAGLAVLDMSGNRLSGSHNLSAATFTRLAELDLSGNKLAGSPPPTFASASAGEFGNDAAFAGLSAAGCSDGTFVAAPQSNGALVADCQILVAVRNHWTGAAANAGLPSDHSLRSWGQGRVAAWPGVTVSGGRVTQLSLRGDYRRQPGERSGLAGTVPARLGALTGLTHLLLDNNDFTGPIPSLGTLSSLTYLWLDHNRLTGSLPSWLGNMGYLRQLRLNDNDLSGDIPHALKHLTRLTHLWLGNNRLSGSIPTGFRYLTRLRELFLNDNDLSGKIPSRLGHLSSLVRLNLGGNRLSDKIPSKFDGLDNLVWLLLDRNRLTGRAPLPEPVDPRPRAVPARLGNLDNLEVMWLNDNLLHGQLPYRVGALAGLWDLDLSGNRLSGFIPPRFGAMSALRWLDMSGNRLSGALLPARLGELGNLEWMLLHGNDLTGEIPSRFGDLTNLRWLRLDGNDLTGEPPSRMGSLTKLRWLRLDGNRLAGPVPGWLTGLTALEELYLNDNMFTGSVPAGLGAPVAGLRVEGVVQPGNVTAGTGGAASALRRLRVCGNDLTGGLPSHLRNIGDGASGRLAVVWLDVAAADHGDLAGCRRAVDLSARPGSVAESSSAVSVTVTADLVGYGGSGRAVWARNGEDVSYAGSLFGASGNRQPPPPEADLSVTVSVGAAGDGAAAGTDYAAVDDFTVTIPAGATSGSGSFALSATDDDAAGEGDETVTVAGTLAGVAVTGTSVTITDGDAAPTRFTVGVSVSKVAEGSGTTRVTATVAYLTGSAVSEQDQAVTVSVGAAGDSATSGVDYAAVSDLRVIVSGGQRSGTGTFDLRVADDDIAEGSESLTVGGTRAGYDITGTSIAITDDDAPPSSIGLRVSPSRAAEAAGSVKVTVTAAFPDGSAVFASDTAVTVSVGALGDSAVSGTDYTAVDDFTVSIPAGSRTGSASFLLRGTADDVAGEGSESLKVFGAADGFTIPDASVSITDGDAAPTSIGLTVSPVKVAESASAHTVAVTASLPDGAAALASDTAVTVSVGEAGDSAVSGTDYTAVDDFTVTIPAGRRSGSGKFVLAGTYDGIAGEGAESLTVSGTAAGFKIPDASVSITDGDAAPTRIGLRVSPAKVAESASAQTITVTVSLPDGSAALASDTAVTVSVGEAGDSAVSGTDYTAVDDFTVTIPAGRRSGSGKFVLAGTDDNVAGEGAESLTVSGVAAGFAIPDASVSITDGDAAPTRIGLSVSPESVDEDSGSVNVSVTASLPDGSAVLASDTAVTVSVGADDDSAASGADYTAVGDFTVTIPAGQRSVAGKFVLAGTDDNVAGEGSDSLTVSGAAAGFKIPDASVSITDGDAAPTEVGLSVSPESVDEGSGSVNVSVTASLPDGSAVLASNTAVTVSVGADDDSAASGTDYTTVGDFTVTIPAGQRSVSGKFVLAVTDDDVAEGAESLSVSGMAAGMSVSGASVSITDDDAVVVTESVIALAVSPGSVSEGDGAVSVRVWVSLLEGAPAGGVTVGLSVGGAGDSATAGEDYGRVDGLLAVIAEGKSSGWVDFRLNVTDDDAVEGAESVSLSATASGYRASGATLTINDNDRAGAGPGDGGGSPGPTTSAAQQQAPPPAPPSPPATPPPPVDPPPTDPPPPVDPPPDDAPPPVDPPPAKPLPPADAPPPTDLPPASRPPPSGGAVSPPPPSGGGAGASPPPPATGAPPPVGDGGGGVAPPPAPPVAPVGEVCVGRFCDEDGSVHQENIERAAEWGITNGCGEGRFCPGLSISRSQMAAFLYRAVSYRTGVPPSAARFAGLSDVGEGAWYGVFARWAVSTGVMSARGGEFLPGGVVTRGDMALMLTAAFPALADDSAATGLFQDLDASGDTARAAEALHRAGVTRGCSTAPLRFCPDEPVTRSQMASFFVRALTALQ